MIRKANRSAQSRNPATSSGLFGRQRQYCRLEPKFLATDLRRLARIKKQEKTSLIRVDPSKSVAKFLAGHFETAHADFFGKLNSITRPRSSRVLRRSSLRKFFGM
jgi:hypothetical protein